MIAMSIEEFFAKVRDGAWHSIDELAEHLELPTSKLADLSKFLSQHGLLKYDDRSNKIRIEPLWKLLLPNEDESPEHKTMIATFVIPPETSIDVQATRLTNISNIEVEVSLRMDNRIREVAIKV